MSPANSRLTRSLCLAVTLLTAAASTADTYNWNGSGPNNWNNSVAWTHVENPLDGVFDDGTIPSGDDFVTIANGNLLNINVDTEGVDRLTITAGSDVSTNGNQLFVNIGNATGLTRVIGGGSTLHVDSGSGANDFDTDILDLEAGGKLEMDGGFAQIDNILNVDAVSSITGRGTIQFRDNLDTNGQHLELDGTLRPIGGTLTLQAIHGGTLDLDGGAGNSVIDVTSGTSSLVVQGSIADTFSGTMSIGSGNTVDMVNGWSSNGTLNLSGGVLTGGTFTQSSGTTTASSGTSQIASSATLSSGTIIVNSGATLDFTRLTTIASGPTLNINGRLDLEDATLNGTTFGGNGLLRFNDVINVNGTVTINTPTLNWDGDGSTTNIGTNDRLIINSNVIEDSTDGFDGVVNLGTNARLTVNTTNSWRHEGVMNLGNGAQVDGRGILVSGTGVVNTQSGNSTLATSVEFENGGRLTVINGSTLGISSSRFEPGSNSDIDGTLDLNSTVTYSGGTIGGNGTINQNALAIVTGDQTIELNPNSGIYDMDGNGTAQTQLNSNNSLTISARRIDTSDNIYDGTVRLNAGRLNVTTSQGPWEMRGEVRFQQPGGFSTPQLGGGDVVVGGTITNTAPNAIISAPVKFTSSANVNVGSGNLRLTGSRVEFAGGTYSGSGELAPQSVDVQVTAPTTIQTGIYNLDDGATTIQAGGHLNLMIGRIDGDDQMDGTLTLNGGDLSIETQLPEWKQSWLGTINMNGASGTPDLNGERAVLHGLLNVSGGLARINAPARFRLDPTAVAGFGVDEPTVNIASGAILELAGNSELNDGIYSGGGELKFSDSATLLGGASVDVVTLRLASGGDVEISDADVVTNNFFRGVGTGFELNGGLFRVEEGVGTFNNSFAYGNTNAADQPVVEIADGAQVTVTESWRIADAPGTFAKTTIDGQNGGTASRLRSTSTNVNADLIVGGNGTGELEVLGGGKAEFYDEFIVGKAANAEGTVTVDGRVNGQSSSILLTQNGDNSLIEIGRAGTGTLNITNGGYVETQGDMNVGALAGSSGTVIIEGKVGNVEAELYVEENLTVGGMFDDEGGFGLIIVGDGGKLTVEDDIDVEDDGDIDVLDGGDLDPKRLTINGGSFSAAAARVVISDSGVTTDTGFFVGLGGGTGTVIVKNGGELKTADATVGGSGGSSTVMVEGEGAMWQVDGMLHVADGGTVDANGGQVMADMVVIDDGGTVESDTRIAAPLVNSGLLSPGDSPGILAVDSTYEQTASGTLLIELGGLTVDSEYDLLDIAQTATLDGTLEIALFDLGDGPFAPSNGDSFQIVTAGGGVDGEFATLIEPALPAGLAWNLVYDPTSVILNVIADVLFAADFDSDGDVDGEDFLAWQNGFGITAGAQLSDGDANGDGDVDGEDFLAWQTELGSAAGGGSSATSRVPEPHAATIATLLLVAMLTRRRR